MLALNDSVTLSVDALKAHKLRASLTLLGLTMGVATLITVITLVQGANVYVETKIANLGSDVFQVARTPFAVTDFELVMKALKYKHIYWDDYRRCSRGLPGLQDYRRIGAGKHQDPVWRSGDHRCDFARADSQHGGDRCPDD